MASKFEDLKALKEMLERGEISEREYEIVKTDLLSDGGETEPELPTDLQPPGWYTDPDHSSLQRYWNGEDWTDSTRPAPTQPAIPGADPSPSATTSMPSYEQSTNDKTPLVQRKGFWLIVGIAVLVIFVNLGGDSSSTSGPAVTSPPSVGLSCEAYMNEMSDLATEAASIAGDASAISTDVVAGTMSFSAGAAYLRGAADDLANIDRRITALGQPPTNLTTSTRLMHQTLDTWEEAWNTAATGFATSNLALIEDATALLADGNQYIEDATAAIGPCP